MDDKEVPDMTGLYQVKGNSFEEVVRLLKEGGIEFSVNSGPHISLPHVRSSQIHIDKNKYNFVQIEEVLGKPERTRAGMFISYTAEYVMGEDFDVRHLDGTISFRKGKLIEKVEIERGSR